MADSAIDHGDGLDFGSVYWLVAVEAAMRVHRQTYPGDGAWRRWIRAQSLPAEWFDRLCRQAQAVLDGRATRFIDAEGGADLRVREMPR